MKLTTFLLLICFTTLASNGYSQAEKVSIKLKNASIKELFQSVEIQTSYKFLYRDDAVENIQITMDDLDKPLDTILNEALKGSGLVYKILPNNLIVVASNDFLQQLKIIGTVTDEKGNPVPGVTVLLKGTTLGTLTDASGKYTLTNAPQNATLIFSFIGKETLEVLVNGRMLVDVVLKEAAIGLNEVVVIGYGTAKKSDLTGSVASVSSAQIEKQPILRMEDALNGKVSGVQVQKPNGAPGSEMKIKIRGTNSINGDNTPLYVIDGFIGGDIVSLNPDEIESINVLKDASATAIYGSRGSNGVVIVTTKTAKSGDAKIQFNAFYSINQISKTYHLMNGTQYMQYVNEGNSANGLDPQFTQSQIDAVKNAGGGTDWQKEIFRNSGTQNYQLSFSGGTEKTQYYTSGSIADQEGIMINSNYKRYGLRTNINSKLRDNFNLVFTMYSSYEESRNNYDQTGRFGPAGAALIYPTNLPVWDPVTNYYTITPSYGPVGANPVAWAKLRLVDNKKFQSLATLQMNYEITKDLVLSVSGGANGYFYNNPNLYPPDPGTPLSTTSAVWYNGYGWNFQNTNMLTYSKIFAEKHSLKVSAIYEQQISMSRYNTAQSTGFPTIALGYDNLGLGTALPAYSGYSSWAIQSYVGRLNYTYNDKYLLTATIRADGSSKFNGNNKYGYFPSVAFGWRMSDEQFIKNLNIFKNLKLRASYGLTGSQGLTPYQTLSVMNTGQNYSYNGSDPQAIGIGPGIAANPDLKWETTAQTNVGFDFEILNGRLSGTVDYYLKKTTDLLMQVPIPMYSGGGELWENIGSVQNKGFEFLLSGVLIDQSDLKLNSSFNISFNRNKILNLGNDVEGNPIPQMISYGGYDTQQEPKFLLKVGEPIGEFRGLVYEGLWQTASGSFKPGDPKYKDQNADDNITGADMVDLGSSQPKFTWGWNTTLEYKGFDLSLYVTGVQGNKVWNMTHWLTIARGADVKNPVGIEALNYWTPTNTNTNVASLTSNQTTWSQSTQFLEDGSFIRLSNVTLGYTFPKKILNHKLGEARIYVSGQNLLLITKYSGIDPALSATPGNTDISQGIDNGTYPSTRTITFGIKVGF
jgi:TonB-linked SusC/RagA family outer membrane protein